MVARYCHLSAEDMKDSVMEIYGLVDKKTEKGLDSGAGNICGTYVPAGSRHCLRCGRALTKDAQNHDDATVQKISAILAQHRIS